MVKSNLGDDQDQGVFRTIAAVILGWLSSFFQVISRPLVAESRLRSDGYNGRVTFMAQCRIQPLTLAKVHNSRHCTGPNGDNNERPGAISSSFGEDSPHP